MYYTKIRVQKGIPIPPHKPRGKGGRARAKYPWRDMALGDSFLFPPELSRQSYSAASQAGWRTGWIFMVRRTECGFRVWRVA